MTTIAVRPGPGAATHVLAIGVGTYPFLSRLTRYPELALLEQLDAPPDSAGRFASWLHDHLNSDPPLGTIELITAPAQAGDPVATLQSIQASFDTWFDRCDSDPNNVAVFYFCGHGVTKDDLILLAHNFGEAPHRLEQGAFSFDKTYQALGECRATTQWFFVDACRSISPSLLPIVGPIPGLRTAAMDAARYRPGCVLYAASPNATAYERIGGPTRFTEALMDALEGRGAERLPDGRWGITRVGLDKAVAQTLDRGNRLPNTPWQSSELGPAAENPALHYLSDAPELDVTIATTPPAAADQAEFALSARGQVRYSRPPAIGEWKTRVRAAVYVAQATFAAPEFRGCIDELWAIPPYPQDLTLEV